MQLTQSIRSNSYVKGVSNDIIFTLYISCTINLVYCQIKNHLEYKSRSMYESKNIDWALLNVDTFLIKVEILWLHIKPICKLERIGGSILYVQKWNEHWIPFIYDLRMLWSPVQNFESALGITHAPTRSLSISSWGLEIDWKKTRVGTICSFRLWTYNILPLIPTDPPPPVGHFYHRNRPNLYLLARTQLISEHQSISSTCVGAWTEWDVKTKTRSDT